MAPVADLVPGVGDNWVVGLSEDRAESVSVGDHQAWGQMTTAENTQKHPVRDSNPCYHLERVAS